MAGLNHALHCSKNGNTIKNHLSQLLIVTLRDVILQFHEISIPPPQRVSGNSKGEGVAKEKVFKERYTYRAKLEFPEGWGLQTKQRSVARVGGGTVWIFSETTHYIFKGLGKMRLICSPGTTTSQYAWLQGQQVAGKLLHFDSSLFILLLQVCVLWEA